MTESDAQRGAGARLRAAAAGRAAPANTSGARLRMPSPVALTLGWWVPLPALAVPVALTAVLAGLLPLLAPESFVIEAYRFTPLAGAPVWLLALAMLLTALGAGFGATAVAIAVAARAAGIPAAESALRRAWAAAAGRPVAVLVAAAGVLAAEVVVAVFRRLALQSVPVAIVVLAGAGVAMVVLTPLVRWWLLLACGAEHPMRTAWRPRVDEPAQPYGVAFWCVFGGGALVAGLSVLAAQLLPVRAASFVVPAVLLVLASLIALLLIATIAWVSAQQDDLPGDVLRAAPAAEPARVPGQGGVFAGLVVLAVAAVAVPLVGIANPAGQASFTRTVSSVNGSAPLIQPIGDDVLISSRIGGVRMRTAVCGIDSCDARAEARGDANITPLPDGTATVTTWFVEGTDNGTASFGAAHVDPDELQEAQEDGSRVLPSVDHITELRDIDGFADERIGYSTSAAALGEDSIISAAISSISQGRSVLVTAFCDSAACAQPELQHTVFADIGFVNDLRMVGTGEDTAVLLLSGSVGREQLAFIERGAEPRIVPLFEADPPRPLSAQRVGADLALDAQGRPVVLTRSDDGESVQLLRCGDAECTDVTTTPLTASHGSLVSSALAFDGDRLLIPYAVIDSDRPARDEMPVAELGLRVCGNEDCSDYDDVALAADLLVEGPEAMAIAVRPDRRVSLSFGTRQMLLLQCLNARCGV